MYFWYTHLLLLIHIFNGNTPVRQRKKENGCQKEEREEIVRWVASLAYTSVCFCVWKNRQLAPGTMHVIVKFGRQETLGSAKKKTEHKRQRKSRNAKVLVSCGLSEWFFQLSWVFLTFTFKIHRPIQIIIASLKKKLWNVLNKAQPTSRFMQPEKHTHKLSFISNAKCAKFPRKFRSTWNTVVSVCSQLKIDRKRKENKTESVSKEIFS